MSELNSDESMKVIGVIPSYRPDEKLTATVSGVLRTCPDLYRLIVVDDGSGSEFTSVFAEVAVLGERVEVVHLAVNSGMGGAIKAGLQYGLYKYSDAVGVVAFDADGQHHPEDIEHVMAVFKKDPSKFVIGVREYHDSSLNIPLRSRFGNRVTEVVFRLFTGVHLTDTQSGLRCYPRGVAEACTQVLRSRYEFQLEALMIAIEKADCIQVPIRTIYEQNNRRSHFNPIVDSLKIYAVFLRFIGSSFICCALDYFLFAFVYLFTGSILHSFIVSKVISDAVNFILNKRSVFRAHGNVLREIVSFATLATALFFGAYYGVRFMKDELGISPLISKIIVESILFVCSYGIQRAYVFARRRPRGDGRPS